MSGWVSPRIRTLKYAGIYMRLLGIMAYSLKHCGTTFWCFIVTDGQCELCGRGVLGCSRLQSKSRLPKFA